MSHNVVSIASQEVGLLEIYNNPIKKAIQREALSTIVFQIGAVE
jgi:hypothetical protein